jgi:hypothetical protein
MMNLIVKNVMYSKKCLLKFIKNNRYFKEKIYKNKKYKKIDNYQTNIEYLSDNIFIK